MLFIVGHRFKGIQKEEKLSNARLSIREFVICLNSPLSASDTPKGLVLWVKELLYLQLLPTAFILNWSGFFLSGGPESSPLMLYLESSLPRQPSLPCRMVQRAPPSLEL